MRQKNATQLATAIRAGELSVTEAVEETLAAIQTREGELHAFITCAEETRVRERATQVQSLLEQGELADSPLAGVPVAVKDNISVADMRMTCGSRMLENYVPPYSSTAVERLEQAGAIIIGKTNLDEFGMGSTTETSAFGVTRNPHDPERVPGGSSGGSAAAVAADMVPCALGSDTGGSIRQPVACCGVTGLKPTYGTVSRYGLTAYGSSLEQIGPIAGCAEDCAALLETIAGWDGRDSTLRRRGETGFTDDLSTGVEGVTIGIPRGLTDAVSEEAGRRLASAGATLRTIELDLSDYVVPAYYIIACAEASANLSRFDGVKYGYRAPEYESLHDMIRKSRTAGFGEEVRRRIRLGTFVLSEGYYDDYYQKACRVRRMIREAYDRAFEEVDLILTPVMPGIPPRIGESLSDPLRMYRGDCYTVPANLTGHPAISFPCGFTEEDGVRLPAGAQLTGRPFAEKQLLRAVYAYERI